MNHTRQQGLGNIIWALSTGRTLYLNEHGVTFNALFAHGFHIQKIGDIKSNGLRPINQNQQMINRQLLNSFYPDSTHVFQNLELILNQWKNKQK